MKRTSANLEKELGFLTSAPLSELRDRWKALFKSEPPTAYGPDLLRRAIAHRLQEQAFGALSKPTQTLLNQLVKAMEAKRGAPLKLQRRMQPGSELIRTWKSVDHRVTVQSNGFTYKGKRYLSLSEVAMKITGTKWNGPRFFGLRPKPELKARRNAS